MTRCRFSQVDVFGGRSYRGNPVAVIHDADELTTERMQAIARWTNLSETTFLLAPTMPEADYRVRIFTASVELPFAGHPTLGSCHAWLDANPETPADTVLQECGVGMVPIRRHGDRLAFAAPPLINTGPVANETLDHIAAGLGIPTDKIVASQLIDNGPGWIGILLSSADAVLEIDQPHLTTPVGLVGRHPEPDPYAVELRAFFPSGGTTSEDPVTGSLNASVAQWLLAEGVLTAPYVAHQGGAVGADGVINIDRDSDGTIWVGGHTASAIEGTIRI